MKRFRIKKDDQLKDTNTFVFTFNTPNLPSTIKIAFLRVGVEVYIPNPLRCFSCQQYGHHEDRCKNHPVCSNCGEPAIHHATLCKSPAKCANCGEGHNANSKECKIWHKEKEILRVKFTRNVSFPEARKIVESPTPVPGSSYASVIKPTTKHVSFTDATTQTDPVTILNSEEGNETQMSESNNVTKTTTTQTKTTTTAEQMKTTSSLNQGNQASKEQPVLKKATLEMMRKDWQKLQQKERQQNNKPSSPKNKTSNAKNKTQKAQSKKPVVSERQSKGSKDELQLDNKFDILSDESEMELVDTLDHSPITDTVSWSPILPPSP